MFDWNDEEVLKAKSNLYTENNGVWSLNKEIEHRQMSNNSIVYSEKPSREQWSKHMRTMRFSAEPGFVNLEAIQKRRPNGQGVNP